MQRAQIPTTRTLLVTLLCTLFLSPAFAFAQTTGTSQSYDDLINQLLQQRQQDAQNPTELQKSAIGGYLDVKVNPSIPRPNVPVTITVESYLTDLYKANLSWSMNGVVMLRGTGKTSFTFQNGPSGQSTNVSLSIITNKGESVQKNFSFTPVGVTIMWEADTYTPPFYKGKALISPQAGVRIVAIPDITNADNPLGSGNLVYSWKKNDLEDMNASGYGKNFFSFTTPPPLTNTKITLDVSAIDDSARSEMQIYLPQTRPLIVFYEKDPLLGVLYNKPFGEETMLSKKELSLDAAPYFFSNERGEMQTIKYAWSINGKSAQNYGRTITLRNDAGVKGESLVSLAMRGATQTFQSANKSLRIKFAEDSAAVPIF